MTEQELHQRCKGIELLLLDVDGVLTDGSIVYGHPHIEIKAFHVRDGSGIKLWTAAGKRVGILSGRNSPIVARRTAELGIGIVVQGRDDKRAALAELLQAATLTAGQVCYVGDDLPDVPLLRECGVGIAVADACAEARAAADVITLAAGGRGAVREAVELLLKAQGLWQTMVERCFA